MTRFEVSGWDWVLSGAARGYRGQLESPSIAPTPSSANLSFKTHMSPHCSLRPICPRPPASLPQAKHPALHHDACWSALKPPGLPHWSVGTGHMLAPSVPHKQRYSINDCWTEQYCPAKIHNLRDLQICLVTFDLAQTEIQMAQPLTWPSSSLRKPQLCGRGNSLQTHGMLLPSAQKFSSWSRWN